MKKQQSVLKTIFILSVLGVILSGYLVVLHYSEDKRICDINEIFNCSKVSASDYSVLLGIPVAFFGFLGYFLLALISLGIYRKNFWKKKLGKTILIKKIFSSGFLLLFSLLTLMFSLYLTFAEAFFIKAFCIFCLFSQAIIFGIVILSSWNFYLRRK
jgi:uncharacterized membrane protein